MKHKKPKTSSKKKQKGQKKTLSSSSPSQPPSKTPSVDDLIEAGEIAAGAGETEQALGMFLSAESLLRNESSSPTATTDKARLVYVLEKVGEQKASLGDHEAAKQDFENAIQLLLSSNTTSNNAETTTAQYHENLAALHLYVGQLSSDQEALEAYKKGLQSLEMGLELRQKEYSELQQQTASMEETDTDNKPMEIMETAMSKSDESKALVEEARHKLANARATVAELYLTDLCFEENAETECESYVHLALKINDTDGEPMIDALQTATSLRLSQKRTNEAIGFILRAYAKMKTGCEALAKLVGLDGGKSKRSAELEEVDAADSLPSFDFRCQTVKLLLECAAPPSAEENAETKVQASWKNMDQERIKCYDASIQVLGSLMAENDEVPEVWYLLGCAYMGSGNKELASHYWTSALEMLTKIQKEMEKASEEADMQDDEDENEELDMQIQSISCQMEEIRSKLEDIEDEDDDDAQAMEE